MEGIVSLLDAKHDLLIRGIWGELESRFGLRDVATTPFPHLSYAVAGRFDRKRIAQGLAAVARQFEPFSVEANGLALFTGPAPVIYVPVVRHPLLSQFHSAIHNMFTGMAEDEVLYYRPERWVPHLALAYGDLKAAHVGEVVGFLAELDLRWQITIDNLCLGQEGEDTNELALRYELGRV
jgi:2'-5' RNA ligase